MPSAPYGYLISAGLLAVATWYALAPRRLRVGSLGYYLAVVNEVPFLAFLLWFVLPTGLALVEDDLNTPIGWLSFGLSVLALAGLVVVVGRGLQAAPAIRRALDEGLGEGWRASLEAGLAARLRSPFTFRMLLGPLFVRRLDVVRTGDLRYGDAGWRNLLDVYQHRSRPANCPVLIHFHGGAMMTGKKNSQGLPLLYHLASQGWVCVSANYRLSPAATFPDQLIDCKKVIAWVRAHAQAYGANPDVIFVAGGSAGGQLAALAALTPNDPTLQPGFESADTSVTAAIPLYGDFNWLDTAGRVSYLAPVMKSTPAEDRATWELASPLAHLRPDAPPFFILHGDLDVSLPVENAREFAQQLRRISRSPVVYAELPGAHHNFDLFQSIRAEAVIAGIEAFAAWVRANPT